MPAVLRAVEKTRWAEAKQLLGTLRAAQLRYKEEYVNRYADSIDKLDVDYSPPKYFNITVANNPGNVAQADRNKVNDTFNLNYNRACIWIDKEGAFTYRRVPEWLK